MKLSLLYWRKRPAMKAETLKARLSISESMVSEETQSNPQSQSRWK
jgi:hypothetical protein